VSVQESSNLRHAEFTVIVHRLDPPKPGGDWLVRVYADREHVHSAEGGVSLNGGLEEAQRAMVRWCDENRVGPTPATLAAADRGA
jgi:hypothetical protein